MKPYVVVRHKVQDYAKWKAAFDQHEEIRRKAGSLGAIILRNEDDPQELVILMEVNNLQDARRFIMSDDTREVMKGAGVIDTPTIYLLDQLDRSGA